MNSIAMLVVLSATSGLFGGRQVATTTCASGNCGAAYTYTYAQAVPATCTTGNCPTPTTYSQAAPVAAASYSSYYYAPQQQQVQAMAARAAAPAPVAQQAAPTYSYAPVQTAARYYYPTTYPTWSGSCPNGNCATVR